MAISITKHDTKKIWICPEDMKAAGCSQSQSLSWKPEWVLWEPEPRQLLPAVQQAQLGWRIPAAQELLGAKPCIRLEGCRRPEAHPLPLRGLKRKLSTKRHMYPHFTPSHQKATQVGCQTEKLKVGSFKRKDLKFHPALPITYCFQWDSNQSQMLRTFGWSDFFKNVFLN